MTAAFAQGLDPAQVAGVFRRTRRIHIPGFLPQAEAVQLHAALVENTPWSRSFQMDGRGVSIPRHEWDAQSDGQRAGFTRPVLETARTGFQYLFDSWSVSDEVEAGRAIGHPAEAFYALMNGAPFLEWIAKATGATSASYVDAQCTRFMPGDFLNGHTDEAEGKQRLFAYVMSLTPTWWVDWGGLLLFIDQDGHVAEGYTPSFNALNLFEVPQPHAVSPVAAFAGAPRLSITGWIRAGRG